MRATSPTHLILIDLIISDHTWGRVRVVLLLLLQLPPASYYFIPLGPNILLSTLFSKIISLRSSLLKSETKFHTHTKLQNKKRFCMF
jgi:hypothetical protein